MKEEKKSIGARLREAVHAIGAAIGNLVARVILGKKGFNEAYQISLKNSIAEDIKAQRADYMEKADPPEMEKDGAGHERSFP